MLEPTSGVDHVTSVFNCTAKCGKRCACECRELDGKTVIVTGATHGLGMQTTESLARRGARVVMAVRNTTAGQEVSDRILASHRAEIAVTPVVMKCDLASLQSIRDFAQKFCDEEERLDVLINNAGVVSDTLKRTEDGFELTFGVNHLGHFLLTNLLLPKLRSSANARIINISSEAYRMGRLNLGDINCHQRKYSLFPEYASSKLANIYFTTSLIDRLRGTGIFCAAVHPGTVNTNIFSNASSFFQCMVSSCSCCWRSPLTGAQTQIHLAVCCKLTERHNGSPYYVDCQPKTLDVKATNGIAGEKLWEISCKMVGIPYSPAK